ncbi:hypothetical protein [Litorivivens sp.]|uniref:hypothetical protein n=1 Tax=Litorivivens sp. TaxID=2020868 RepID=UPI00356ADBAB
MTQTHLGVLLLAATLAYPAQAGKLLFRYQDEQGSIVLNDTLPPAAVNRGYEVIKPGGQVVKRVAPALPPGAAEAADLAREREAQQKRWDESLLLRYSDVNDIREAKKRALSDIQVRISILKGNRNYLKTQVEREVFRAAEAERQGQKVSDAQLDAIATLKQQLSDVEELIEVRETEKEQTAARYDRDLARFAALLDAIGGRR